MIGNQQRHQTKKRKCTEDSSKGPVEPNCILSIEDFMASLCQQALTGEISYPAYISTEELPGDTDEVLKVISACMWEVTGFRFTYGQFPLEVQGLILPIIQ